MDEDFLKDFPLSPGLMDELEAYMAPVGDVTYNATQQDASQQRRGHQLPESPPDSGSENPYSPTENQVSQAIAVSLNEPYMLDHLSQELIQQNGDYIYEELKGHNLEHDIRESINEVVVLQSTPNIDLNRQILPDELTLNDQYQNRYDHINIEGQSMLINPQLVPLSHEPLTPVYASLQTDTCKKRKLSQDVKCKVKCEPEFSPEGISPQGLSASARPVPAPPSVDGSEAGDDAQLQCIRFSAFQQTQWHTLFDQNFKVMPMPSYVVGADKGFNYSQIDEAFVCQKKNHFQVTCQVQVQGDPFYVKTNEGFKKINNFYLHFYGVKAEDPTQDVRVEQSQSDRTKKPFHPVPVEIRREGTKVTVGRLHFAETTNNNMRKKGRPNPDQRHFQLVVALRAHSQNSDYVIAAHASDRIIVRASNPGQFESDSSENWWQRGVSENSLYFNGRVGINNERPDESCVINGNLKVTGNILYPSDARAKHNIVEIDTAQQLRNVQSIRVVKFNYDMSFAEHSGLLGFDPANSTPHADTGVIAQEVRQVIPEAVKEAGDVRLPNGDTIHKFLVVNKDRIFMENLGAVKELCKVTGNLESRVNHLEKMNNKLCKISILQRRDSNRSCISNDSRNSFGSMSNSSKSFCSDGNISIDQIREIARNIRRHEYCHKLSHNTSRYHRKQCRGCKTNEQVKHHSNRNSNSINNSIYSVNRPQTGEHDLKNEYNSLGHRKIDMHLGGNSCRHERRNPCGRASWHQNRESVNRDLFSNRILQMFIMILMSVMGVCLVVMTSLYFVEHRKLLVLQEKMRIADNNCGKSVQYEQSNAWPKPTTASFGDNRLKQIPNIKTSFTSQQYKKAIHIGKEYATTTNPTEMKHAPDVTALPIIPILVKKKDDVSKSFAQDDNRCSRQQYTSFKEADPIGQILRGCTFGGVKLDLKDDVDIDCQSSCNLDPPQAYDTQEPVEAHPQKEINETNKQQVVETAHIIQNKNKGVVVPPMPERNASENSVIIKNEVSSQLQEEDNSAFNDLKSEVNGTDLELTKKVKRNSANRFKRSSSEELIYQGPDCSVEDDITNVSFGIRTETYLNESMFVERICTPEFMNFTYHIPISKCFKETQIGLSFKSSKIKELKLCNFDNKICEVDNHVNCDKELVPIEDSQDVWLLNMSMDCNMSRLLKLRAAFMQQRIQDLCLLPPDQKLGFVEYNIKLSKNCST